MLTMFIVGKKGVTSPEFCNHKAWVITSYSPIVKVNQVVNLKKKKKLLEGKRKRTYFHKVSVPSVLQV